MNPKSLFLAGAALLASLLAIGTASAAAETTFYSLPTATHATSLTAGPDGDLWFVGRQAPSGELVGNPVAGRVSTDGQVEVFALPERRLAGQIASGPDGDLWFTESYANRRGYLVGRIGRITPAGDFSEFCFGDHVGLGRSIVAGPDGNLWFTSAYSVKGRRRDVIGRISPSGEVKQFRLPPFSGPNDIAAGPDGNLWFTERGHGVPKIGRITTAGQVTQFPLPDHGVVPGEIAAGPDGNLWFTEGIATYAKLQAKVGRITPAGAITEFTIPGGRNGTAAIAAGPGGRIWFTEPINGSYRLGSITPDGTVTVPTCLPAPSPCELDADALSVGSDGELWFAASTFYPHNGGGGSGIAEGIAEAAEAGLVGRY